MTDSFYQLLHKLVVDDPDIVRYRGQMDALRKRIVEIRAKADAECDYIMRQIDIVGQRERHQVNRLTRRFLNKRRKETGLSPIGTDKLHAVKVQAG